jgi:hypothetical protein
MNKKILTVVLVALLAMTGVFASVYRGETRVGLNLGMGADGWGKSVDNGTDVLVYGGAYIAGTFQYGLSDCLAVKAEAGVNTYSQFVRSYANGTSSKGETTSRPANFAVSAAIVYDLPIGRIFDIQLQFGADALIGKSSFGSDEFNVALGVDCGVAFVVNFTDEISLVVNSKYNFYVANTNETIKKAVSDYSMVFIGAQNTVGVTYSL